VTFTTTNGDNYTLKKEYNASLVFPAYTGYFGVSGSISYINKTFFTIESLEKPYLGFTGIIEGPPSGFLIAPFSSNIAAGRLFPIRRFSGLTGFSSGYL
jgi:hypothetical protein